MRDLLHEGKTANLPASVLPSFQQAPRVKPVADLARPPDLVSFGATG